MARKKQNETEKKKWDMSLTEKKERAMYIALPKKSKVRELLINGDLSFKELESAMPALVIASSFDRKNIGNMFLTTIMCTSSLREVKKITREQLNRYKSRKKTTRTQRAYFEDRLLFGWNEYKEKRAKAKEVMDELEFIIKDNERNEEYKEAGVDLTSIVRKIKENKLEFLEICYSIEKKLEEAGETRLASIFTSLVEKGYKKINRVNDMIFTGKEGKRRPYIPAHLREENKYD